MPAVSQSEASSSSALRFHFGLSLTSSLRNKKIVSLKSFFFYVSTEEDFVKSWKSRLLSHCRHLLVVLCITVAIILALGIGLGGQFLIFRKSEK